MMTGAGTAASVTGSLVTHAGGTPARHAGQYIAQARVR
jgi:hypothetical protein